MAAFKASKVVSALPGTLEASTVYFVRAGTGFDMFVTNESGTLVAYPLNQSKGLSSFCSGKPAASEKVGGGTAPYDFTLSVASSSAIADVAATASTTFIIQRNGTQIGTIVFGAGATAGVITFAQTNITAGQKLRIIAPVTADATLADISFLLGE